MINVDEKKARIISYIETNGPSLPVRIAKSIEMDPVFASAILSELLGIKKIKLSNMKVGSSPLYLLDGQEQRLEEHSDNLKSIEKEAYLKLKKELILLDEEESPAIRVALRSLKDFAKAFKYNEKIYWRYMFAKDSEIEKKLKPKAKEPVEKEAEVEKEEIVKDKTEPEKPNEEKTNIKEEEMESKEEIVPKAWEVKKEEVKKAKEESKKSNESTETNAKKVENIFEKKEDNPREKKPVNKTFLNKVEEFLESKKVILDNLVEVDKKKVIAKTDMAGEKALLFAFNKNRITEQELMKCYKQAKAQNLQYHIIILGDLTKKLNETIDAYKSLINVDKLEE